MSQQYSHRFENCATCSFWGGTRNFLNISQQIVVVEGPMARGKCYCRDSGRYWSTEGTQANYCCKCYEKWSAIRS